MASNASKKDDVVPPIEPGVVRVIPLGGVEEIGRNMTAIEIGDDILVIDCGFQFKEVETPGIDYILPNTKYLEDNKHRVRALFITHGHLDHIGGIPFIIDRIGMPPIYTRNLTAIMVKKRQAEFPHIPPLDLRVIETNDRITVGQQSVRFFGVTHTIPDSLGIIVETPDGAVVVPSDYKLEHEDGVPSAREEENYQIFDDLKVLLLLLDSTNIENPGWSTPEKYVHQNLDQFIKEATGRLIIGTFASQMERMISIIHSAEKYQKRIIVEGRSMKGNIEIAKQAGLLKVSDKMFVSPAEAANLPKDKIVVLATGAQGEEFAALSRMANKTHKNLHIEKGDTVLLSASIVPGNERAVARLKDNIARAGAHIISYRTSDVYVHSTGHGNQEEIKWLHRKIKPTYFMPIHGSHYNLRVHEDLAVALGMPEDHVIVPDNSSIIEVADHGKVFRKLPVKAPAAIRMVDGIAIGDLQEVVLKDRQALSEDGMFVVIALLNTKTGKLKKSPDIISRGFVYLRESQDLLSETRIIAKKTIEESTRNMNPLNFEFIRKNLSDTLASYLLQKTHKHPIVIPVVIGI
ncbi:RNase J family beta-CASP ribonuclease [Patescibacteria group bacterium]|jgi:ribonuclease J|nr:RNase J family beta-CASP ribonuclease [Patescibacteria group bacterium]